MKKKTKKKKEWISFWQPTMNLKSQPLSVV